MPRDGIHSVSVPGCVDGWSKMHAKFGRLPWRDLFAAATHYAAEGYPVPELIQMAWRNYETVPFFLPQGPTQIGHNEQVPLPAALPKGAPAHAPTAEAVRERFL